MTNQGEPLSLPWHLLGEHHPHLNSLHCSGSNEGCKEDEGKGTGTLCPEVPGHATGWAGWVLGTRQRRGPWGSTRAKSRGRGWPAGAGLTPNICRRSGSRNRKGILETCNLLGCCLSVVSEECSCWLSVCAASSVCCG